jgi:hypothetical protein
MFGVMSDWCLHMNKFNTVMRNKIRRAKALFFALNSIGVEKENGQ